MPRRGYGNLADRNLGLDATLHPDGRRFDAPAQSAEGPRSHWRRSSCSPRPAGRRSTSAPRTLAGRLVELLGELGAAAAPRGSTTLVSFPSDDPPAERQLLADAGVVVRNIPGRPWLRASVGAWNDEGDLERLVETLAR